MSQNNLLFVKPYPQGKWQHDYSTGGVVFALCKHDTTRGQSQPVVADYHSRHTNVKCVGSAVPSLCLAPEEASVHQERPLGPVMERKGLNTISCKRRPRIPRCRSAASARQCNYGDGARLLNHYAHSADLGPKNTHKLGSPLAASVHNLQVSVAAEKYDDHNNGALSLFGGGGVARTAPQIVTAVAVLHRLVQETDTADYRGHALHMAYKDILEHLFLDWSRKDEDALERLEGRGVSKYLSERMTYRSRVEDMADMLEPKVESASQMSCMQNYLAKKMNGCIRGRTLTMLIFKSWKTYAGKMRGVRQETVQRISQSRGKEAVRYCFTEWRTQVAQNNRNYAKQKDEMFRENLFKSIALNNRLTDEVRDLKTTVDRLQDLKKTLSEKVRFFETSPSIIDLSKKLRDGDSFIKHGVIEFRHFTEEEQQFVVDSIQSERRERESDLQTLGALEEVETKRHKKDDLAAIHEISCLVSYPYVTTCARLCRDLKSIKFPTSRSYYIATGIRGISAAEEDGALHKGGGYVNRREVLLTWANLRVSTVVPITALDVSCLFTAFEHHHRDCKALLLLLHSIVPITAACRLAQELSVPEIIAMPAHQRQSKVSLILSRVGLYEQEELSEALRSEELFNEDFFNLLLCQVYVYDHLSGKLRSVCANMARKGTDVPCSPLSTTQPTFGDFSKKPSFYRNEVRHASTVMLGMIPRTAPGFGSAASSSPSGVDHSHLDYLPGVGMRKMQKSQMRDIGVQYNEAIREANTEEEEDEEEDEEDEDEGSLHAMDSPRIMFN